MADWVTGKVTKVQNWTDALFSLTVHAPVLPFTAGQFTKLGLEIDGERVQRAYSYVNSPDNPDLEFYLVTVPDGKLSPRLAALKPGDEVQVVSEAAGFFVLDEVPDCETLWMLDKYMREIRMRKEFFWGILYIRNRKSGMCIRMLFFN